MIKETIFVDMKMTMQDVLIDFQIYLKDKKLINNHDFDFEKEAEKFIKQRVIRDYSTELREEWNEINRKLRLVELLENAKDSLIKAEENYSQNKSVFNKGILINCNELVLKYKKKLLSED